MTLWKKDTQAEGWVTRFTVGEDYRWDTLLLPYDIRATRAHGWGLLQIGILSPTEFGAIEEALDALEELVYAGTIEVHPEDEDCHTVIEGFLTQEVGDAGKKIHTGRSRNDQVLAALRLYLKDALLVIGEKAVLMGEHLCTLAERYPAALMPGFTHYQRAMPTTAALWALGYAELVASDLDTLQEALAKVDLSPLGSAAGYGVPSLDLPRADIAAKAGFSGVQLHVTAVQLSRGKMEAQVLHALVQVAATINRMASDLVLFNSAEFGFVELPKAFCTGSSIMPQKQNPDVLELARASYHRLVSELHLLLTLPANLPSGYHRDLQLTKEAVMRGCLLGSDLLEAMTQLLPGVRFRTDRMEDALSPDLFATAEALRLVQEGVPFREAYREAAGALGSIQTPPAEEILAAYHVPGDPGNPQPEVIRERLQERRRKLEGVTATQATPRSRTDREDRGPSSHSESA